MAERARAVAAGARGGQRAAGRAARRPPHASPSFPAVHQASPTGSAAPIRPPRHVSRCRDGRPATTGAARHPPPAASRCLGRSSGATITLLQTDGAGLGADIQKRSRATLHRRVSAHGDRPPSGALGRRRIVRRARFARDQRADREAARRAKPAARPAGCSRQRRFRRRAIKARCAGRAAAGRGRWGCPVPDRASVRPSLQPADVVLVGGEDRQLRQAVGTGNRPPAARELALHPGVRGLADRQRRSVRQRPEQRALTPCGCR